MTGFYLQSLRDNPETAREEFDLIENEKDRGLFAECLFNVEEDICAKFLKNHRSAAGCDTSGTGYKQST